MKKLLCTLVLLWALPAFSQDILTITNMSTCTITVDTMVSQSNSWGISMCGLKSNSFVVAPSGGSFSSPDAYYFQSTVGYISPGPSPAFTSTSYPTDHYYTDIAFTANCSGCPAPISGVMNSGPIACLSGSSGMSFTGHANPSCTLHASWSYSYPNVTITFW